MRSSKASRRRMKGLGIVRIPVKGIGGQACNFAIYNLSFGELHTLQALKPRRYSDAIATKLKLQNCTPDPESGRCTAKVIRDLVTGGKDKLISTNMVIKCWSEANHNCPDDDHPQQVRA